MLKIVYDEAHEDTGECPFHIVDNDRGEWVLHQFSPDAGTATFLGYGGENSLTFHWMHICGDGVDFVAVHQMVDNPSKVAQKRLSFPLRMSYIERFNSAAGTVACLLAEVCAYDPIAIAQMESSQ